MMYLQPIEAYGTLLTKVPEIVDLAEVRAVLGAVSTGDCTPLLRMPGRAVSTFAQIWQATGRQPPKLHLNSITPNRAIGGAVCDLTLMLASDVSPMFSSSLLNQELPGTSLLVDVCTRNSKPLVTPIPQSYLDEQALLFNGHNAYEVMQLFTTRHDEREDMGFEALSLAGGISGLETIFAPYF